MRIFFQQGTVTHWKVKSRETILGNDYSQRYEITPTSLITANLILFLAPKTTP